MSSHNLPEKQTAGIDDVEIKGNGVVKDDLCF